MGCSLLGSSVHAVLQARKLESRGSSWPRDWTWVSDTSCISKQVFVFTTSATWEAPTSFLLHSTLASVKRALRELFCRRQETIGIRVITSLTKKINLANQMHKNQKSYPVTSITNMQDIKMHRNTEWTGMSMVSSQILSFLHWISTLAQNRWVSRWKTWNITWYILEHLIYETFPFYTPAYVTFSINSEYIYQARALRR